MKSKSFYLFLAVAAAVSAAYAVDLAPSPAAPQDTDNATLLLQKQAVDIHKMQASPAPAAVSPVPLPVTTATPANADTTNGVAAVVQKKIAAATYAPLKFVNLGANATLNVKGTTGNVFSAHCYNHNAATRFLQLHDTATTPSAGATPAMVWMIPGGSDRIIGSDFFTNEGVNFTNGIAFAFSTTENTYTAGAAADQTTQITYK